MIPSEPPKLKSKLPKKLKEWIEDVRAWLTETQAIPGEGLKARETISGRVFKLGPVEPAAGNPSGKTSNPYVMGETLLGSADPKNPVAPNANLRIARTDTWRAEAPPLDIGGNATFGVDVYPVRIYSNVTDGGTLIQDDAVSWDGAYVWLFMRKLRHDDQGKLVHVDIEELQSIHFDPTYGSTFHSTIINR